MNQHELEVFSKIIFLPGRFLRHALKTETGLTMLTAELYKTCGGARESLSVSSKHFSQWQDTVKQGK